MKTLYNLVPNRVFCRIFDKKDTCTSGVYGLHRANSDLMQKEIQRNYQSIADTLGANTLFTLNQVHGNTVIDVDLLAKPLNPEPIGDALLTTQPQRILGVLTADCVPVLLSDTEGKVIGAAHCGWKSTKAHLLQNLVEHLQKKGGTSFRALIGPSIQWSSYEVDRHFYHAFLDDNSSYNRFFKPSQQARHYLFNLPALVKHQLQTLGIHDILHLDFDTYSMADRYPSFRRDTHQGLPKAKNNILSTIFIR